MTLFERVFGGNDAVYGLTEAAIDSAIAQYGESQAVSFPDTAYSLPCYYAVTGVKVGTLGELKAALGVVKTLMTRAPRLNDAFMSGVATALCAEFIEVLKYLNGATPYEAALLRPCGRRLRPEPGCAPGYRRHSRRGGHPGLRSLR